MLPVILVSPHSHTNVNDDLRDRFALADYEIWRCSDPYTDELNEFTCASSKHTADVSRLVCDLNRAPNTHDAFREYDFYDKKAFKDGQKFTTNEKEDLLMRYWYPFHQNIADNIQKLDEDGNEVILLVDYHNTAGDHALNENEDYMTSMILSNLGSEEAYGNSDGISMPYEYLFDLQNFISDDLGISVEINRIYRGGYNLYWYMHLKDLLNIKAKIYAIQIEYNLDYIFNPVSKMLNETALRIMQNSLNQGIEYMYNSILLNEKNCNKKNFILDYM